VHQAYRRLRDERRDALLEAPAGEDDAALVDLIEDPRVSLEFQLEVHEALALVGGLRPRQRRLLALQIAGFRVSVMLC
jgi:hypothetical protein